jgi:hypothetical protein
MLLQTAALSVPTMAMKRHERGSIQNHAHSGQKQFFTKEANARDTSLAGIPHECRPLGRRAEGVPAVTAESILLAAAILAQPLMLVAMVIRNALRGTRAVL